MKGRLVVLTAVTALLLVAAPSANAAKTRECGTTTIDGSSLEYSAQGRVLCRNARVLVRSFFTRKGWRKHGGPTSAETYYTKARFPGWKCGTGAGGGGCTKRSPFRRTIFLASP